MVRRFGYSRAKNADTLSFDDGAVNMKNLQLRCIRFVYARVVLLSRHQDREWMTFSVNWRTASLC